MLADNVSGGTGAGGVAGGVLAGSATPPANSATATPAAQKVNSPIPYRRVMRVSSSSGEMKLPGELSPTGARQATARGSMSDPWGGCGATYESYW